MTKEIKKWQERYNLGMGTIEFCTMQEIAELRAKVESLTATMSDKQIEAIRHGAEMLRLEGYQQQSDDLYAILATTQPPVVPVAADAARPIYQSRSLRSASPGGWFDEDKESWEQGQEHPAYEHRIVYIQPTAHAVSVASDDKPLDVYAAEAGVPIEAVRAANSLLCDMIGKRMWDLPCAANHLHSCCRPAIQSASALQRYNEHMEGCNELSALERLRFFASLSMTNGTDWIDSEQFFDDVEAALHTAR